MNATDSDSIRPHADGADGTLPPNAPALVVTAIGGAVVFASMFMPHLSSREVMFVERNMMIESHPWFLLCAILGAAGSVRFYAARTAAAGATVACAGAAFLGITIYLGCTEYLHTATRSYVPTDPASGMMAMGAGAATILVGGVMMLVPGLGSSRRAAPPPHAREVAIAAYKLCPQCAETIKAAAIRCRFCGCDFEPSTIEQGRSG
jgi:hypothetical protein